MPHYANGACYGRWPVGGQSAYSSGCYGHDEPAINPFSDLPGSGGNVTWQVTLPVDRSPTQNQSEMYAAIWFGMDLYDPYGYNAQCFLELQMYPDTNASGAPQAGIWSAFAVAWQVELANGFENACYAAPLNQVANGQPFQMNQGDRLNVTMTGWLGSPYGENITVVDQTTGTSSFLNLYNTLKGYPLDPAYVANNIQDSLPWSPGGDLPVAFSFESGHTADAPGNNSYGGCSSGAPPSGPLDPAVPCGSYDPWNWSQNTKTPWQILPPVFFNAHQRQTASQFGFEQDFGGIHWIDPLSNGACLGSDGSAFCSYPWYSWSASAHAFEFGATDYTGTTQDFGQFDQYPGGLLTDSSALVFYPVKNFTYESAAGSTLSVIVRGHGSAFLLNHVLRSSGTLSALPGGSYSINAVPDPGSYFNGYSARGGVSLDAALTPWSSFVLTANGTITVTFGGTAPAAVNVTTVDAGSHGFVTVVGGFEYPLESFYTGVPGTGLAIRFADAPLNVANGATVHLLPGMYSFQAQPNPGFRFFGWSARGGAYVFTPESNYTWVNVTGASATITANYASTPALTTVWLASDPAQGGEVNFDGVTYVSGTVLTVPVGSYPIAAVPNASYRFATWGFGITATITDFASATTALLQHGNSYVTAVYTSQPTVRVLGAGVRGAVLLNGSLLRGSATLPQAGDQTYALQAAPAAGYLFAAWKVAPAANLSVAANTSGVTTLTVGGSGTVTPVFTKAPGPLATVAFSAAGGRIVFNGLTVYRGSGTNGSVAPAAYSVVPGAGLGMTFSGWRTGGAVTIATSYAVNGQGEWVAQYEAFVNGSGNLTANFAPRVHPVTFVDFPADPAVRISLTGPGVHLVLHAGRTAFLGSGVYALALLGPAPAGLHWFATTNLTVLGPSSANTSIVIAGSGALYLVGGHTSGGGHGRLPPSGGTAPAAVAGSRVGRWWSRRSG